MRFSHYILTGALLAAQTELVSSYEWKTHNGMALHARRLAEIANGDEELRRFLDQVLARAADGTTTYELDSRAGDPIFGYNIDEDHSEGELKSLVWCWYEDRIGSPIPQLLPQEFPETVDIAACAWPLLCGLLALPQGTPGNLEEETQ